MVEIITGVATPEKSQTDLFFSGASAISARESADGRGRKGAMLSKQMTVFGGSKKNNNIFMNINTNLALDKIEFPLMDNVYEG